MAITPDELLTKWQRPRLIVWAVAVAVGWSYVRGDVVADANEPKSDCRYVMIAWVQPGRSFGSDGTATGFFVQVDALAPYKELPADKPRLAVLKGFSSGTHAMRAGYINFEGKLIAWWSNSYVTFGDGMYYSLVVKGRASNDDHHESRLDLQPISGADFEQWQKKTGLYPSKKCEEVTDRISS